MDCLKCKHYMKDRDACIKCVTENPEIPLTNKGQDFVAYDEVAGTQFEPRFDPTDEMLAEIDAREGDAESGVAIGGLSLSEGVATALSEFLFQLFMLELNELDVIRRAFQQLRVPGRNLSLKAIGDEIGMSKQRVRDVMHSAFSKSPALRAMFPTMKTTLRAAHANRVEKGFRPEDYAGYKDGVKLGKKAAKAEAARKRKAQRERAKLAAKEREEAARRKRLEALTPEERAWVERAERRARQMGRGRARPFAQARAQEAPLLI